MKDAGVSIAVDVGGTTVSAGCVREGRVTGEIRSAPSHADGSAEAITAAIADVVALARESATSPPAFLAVAMPGPFDYAAGVSLMEHKFAAWHGLNAADLLREACGMPAVFVNDADAFALGAALSNRALGKLVVGITLGSGVGSGFVIDGKLVTSGNAVPPRGEIWNLPAPPGSSGAIFEDSVSRRTLERAARDSTGEEWSVRDMAGAANAGDAWALDAFTTYGRALGRGLAMHLAGFRPDAIVFGGGIANAYGLFARAVEDSYREVIDGRGPVFIAEAGGAAALIGAHALAR